VRDDAGEEPEEVTLLDETGRARRFLLHDAIEADGRSYYLVEAADDPEQVLLLEETEGGLETLQGREFDRILALFEAEDAEGGRS
jgi:hypothetical protein